jgi:ABC-type branched-subunit amino acid transport system ATPase component
MSRLALPWRSPVGSFGIALFATGRVVFAASRSTRVPSASVRAQIHALIGPNGAGKTSLFNVISGVQKRTRGRVIFGSEDVSARN